MNTTLKRAADNMSHIDQIMRRVQECEWNPFKLHEIVTLERCLQECSTSDPQFNVILRKLDNESVFVEPTRRLKHLNRSKQEELNDVEHKRVSMTLKEKVDKMNDDIWFYQWKLSELMENEREMRTEISQLEKSIVSVDGSCKLLTDDLGLLLQRVYELYENSLSIIKEQLPEYMRAITKSKLVQQTGSLSLLYRRCLLKLIKQQRKQSKTIPSLVGDDLTSIVYNFKRHANSHFNDYLAAVVNFYRDLVMIYKLYSSEIPAELQHIRTLEKHISELESPVEAAPICRVTHLHHGTIGQDGDNSDNTGPLLLDSSSMGGSMSKLHNYCKESDLTDDPELASMFASISRLCKVLNNSLSMSSMRE